MSHINDEVMVYHGSELIESMGARVVMRHWLEGGTAVTNFLPDLRWKYKAAIEEFGDPYLVLCAVGIPNMGSFNLNPQYHSLHDFRAPRELGPFWKIFENMCGECRKILDPHRKLRWVRDSDRQPLCDQCQVKYDLI